MKDLVFNSCIYHSWLLVVGSNAFQLIFSNDNFSFMVDPLIRSCSDLRIYTYGATTTVLCSNTVLHDFSGNKYA